MFGIIGGTGLYSLEGMETIETHEVHTPWGLPSAPITIGRFGKAKVAFLPRHGVHHQFLPSEINFRANIWALKAVGVRRILSVSATGSLEEVIRPGDLAIPSQYFDHTRGKRAHTFFGDGIVAHISTAEPSCRALGDLVAEAGASVGTRLHREKAYACVEGPRLGTRVESFFLRGAGCHLVGMTNVPEVFLAREAQLCYCTIAIATDYDCWLDDPSQHVTVDKVIALYQQNLGRIRSVLETLLRDHHAAGGAHCSCRESLKHAVLTPESALDESRKERLSFLRD